METFSFAAILVGSRHRGYSIITSNRSDTQRFDVCKMCFFEVNVCLDEYELFARPRVAGHYIIRSYWYSS